MRTNPLAVLSALCFASTAFAGPLSPPAGPVASTPGPEPRTAINATNTPGDADSVFKITQPGSYYLTGNIIAVVGKHGIEITASGVTIDLNGFELAGIPAMGSFDGVSTTVGGLRGITVRNGTVRGWGDDGIDLSTFSPVSCSVAHVHAISNAGDGISIGAASIVSACTASFNSFNGINSSFNCSISDCTVYNNTVHGIAGSVSNVITRCSAYLNTGDGIIGGINSKISDCTSYDNGDEGFVVGAGASIIGSTAHTNTGNGIELLSAASAINCNSQLNNLHGISAVDRCQIIGNSCVRNGLSGGPASGILVNGNDCRIEGNICIENDRGFEINGTANFVIRNTASGNSVLNWDFDANNVCGPILNRSAPASGAIAGDSAPSSLGTTDANANFTH